MSKVSVCMASYNGERFIAEQIDSILPQLKEGDELIISDDSSQDRTLDIAYSYNDPRIKILPNQKFRKAIYNFENALAHADGDIVFLSDQDDVWCAQKIEMMAPLIRTHNLVLCDCALINESGEIIHSSFFELNKSRQGFLNNLFRNAYMGCCMGFSRELLTKSLPFPKSIPMHDIWIGLLGERFYKPYFLKEILIMHRRHSSNASFTGERSKNFFFQKIMFRMRLLKAIGRNYVRPLKN